MARRLAVGIVGAGVVAARFHLPVLVSMDGVRVSWVCDEAIGAAKSLARAYGIAQVHDDVRTCPDVDIVLMATPVGTRQRLVPNAIARGWHVLCEKPFAFSLAEHDALIDAAARHSVQLSVAQVRRYGRATITARRIVAAGIFGPVRRVAAVEGHRQFRTGRPESWHMATPAMSGGALLETGSHLVDQLLFVLGSSRAVLRDGAQRVHRDIELASSFVADVTVAGPVETPCHVDLTWLEDLCNGIFITFERVTLRVGLDAGDPLTLIGPRGETLCELALDPGADSFPQAIFLEWRDFVQACRSGGRSPLDATTVRATTALIEDCYKLARRRRECTEGADSSVRSVLAAPAVS